MFFDQWPVCDLELLGTRNVQDVSFKDLIQTLFIKCFTIVIQQVNDTSVKLQLGWGGGGGAVVFCFALLAFLPSSVISSFFGPK